MWQKIAVIFFLCIGGLGQGFTAQQTLHLSDVSVILDKLFALHIENKELTPVLIRRSFKIFIEQFDPDKSYLLASEAMPYLNLSDEQAAQIVVRLRAKDYSDYVQLNALFQRSIHRAESLRSLVAQRLIDQEIDERLFVTIQTSRFASSEEEITLRQQMKMVRFFLYHQARTEIVTPERKAKVFTLFEKKIRRVESSTLYLNSTGEQMPKVKMEHTLSTKILKSLAKSLDTHTTFFSPEEAYEMRMTLEKQFEGIGVILSEGIDGVMISELVKGSPAEQSGKIKINDLLVEIDGKSVSQIPFDEVLDLLKKKDKGEIILGFRRVEGEQEKQFHVSLNKRPIQMTDDRIQASTEQFGDGVIGKIALHSFYESDGISSEKDMREAIQSFKQKGELHGLILDLRENSGGFLSQAVKVAGLFISNGVVVISKYGKGEVHYLRNIVGRQFYSGPVVILTSKMSASAAEIVAQALQDYGVAVVVGDERTFGKGTIQYQTVTDEKADLFFKVTVGRYYTPSGRSTQIDGVIADIQVPTQYSPYNIGERYLEYPLPPDAVEPAYVDPLSDLEERAQRVFQQRYLPFLQRVVPFWKKLIPQLKKNSSMRISRNPDYQAFLKRIEKIRSRQAGQPVNTIDEPIRIGLEDIQMREAVEIVKDMIQMEVESRPAASFAPTGTDS